MLCIFGKLDNRSIQISPCVQSVEKIKQAFLSCVKLERMNLTGIL